eukprot:gnl/Trimastix_PCT/3536.p1 GENE.gnl/Trimastix_PCT/3536~~gnl/Trimastix_PCT/3536.p1  ORF type:complete len:196 (+),score=15.65 gnl/Trimastix_PCT/3536:55-642(+)
MGMLIDWFELALLTTTFLVQCPAIVFGLVIAIKHRRFNQQIHRASTFCSIALIVAYLQFFVYTFISFSINFAKKQHTFIYPLIDSYLNAGMITLGLFTVCLPQTMRLMIIYFAGCGVAFLWRLIWAIVGLVECEKKSFLGVFTVVAYFLSLAGLTTVHAFVALRTFQRAAPRSYAPVATDAPSSETPEEDRFTIQ